MREKPDESLLAEWKAGLWLGTAKMDITPRKPVPLAGFAHRLGMFTSVADRLYAKVWYFRYYSDRGTFCDALLVQGDLLYWGPDVADSLTDEIAGQYGIDPEAILFHGIHTHSGPQTDIRPMPLAASADPAYLEWLREGVRKASLDLEPVTVERGCGRCSVGINRRRKVSGKICMAPNPDGLNNSEVIVVGFKTGTGREKGILIHYACHLTTTDEEAVSAEFGGLAAEKIADAVGTDTTVSFLQGCCGDIRPALIRNGEFYRGNHSDVERLADRLSKSVWEVLSHPMEKTGSSGIFSAKKTVMLPVGHVPSKAELQHMEPEPGGCMDEWRQIVLKNPRLLRPYIPLTLTWLQIADDLAFIGFGAEVVVHYGLFIKKMSGKRILPLGYTNGMAGYLPTGAQLAEGGYETQEAPYFYGLPGALDPKVQACVEQGVLAMMRQLRP